MERIVRLNFKPQEGLEQIVRSVQYMDTPTPAHGFVVGSWPRAMLAIPVPRRYRFEGELTDRCEMHPVTIVGPHTYPIVSYNDGRRNRGVSVELTELGAYQLFGIDQSELTNRMVDAKVFFPGSTIRELVDIVHESTDPFLINTRIQAVFTRFLRRRSLYPVHPVILRALSNAHTGNGDTVDRIARESATTSRTLRRLFRYHLGISPKRFFAIQRIHAVSCAILRCGYRDLGTLAQMYGFHDHAHLDHALRRELLVNPTTLPGSKRHAEMCAILDGLTAEP